MSELIPPYYAVIFTSTLKDDFTEYHLMAQEMEALVKHQPGFLGMDSARDEIGITISYWDSLESIDLWRNNKFHQEAKHFGKTKWYSSYNIKISKVVKLLLLIYILKGVIIFTFYIVICM